MRKTERQIVKENEIEMKMENGIERGRAGKYCVNDQSYSSHRENILKVLFLSSTSLCHAPLCAHRHAEPRV